MSPLPLQAWWFKWNRNQLTSKKEEKKRWILSFCWTKSYSRRKQHRSLGKHPPGPWTGKYMQIFLDICSDLNVLLLGVTVTVTVREVSWYYLFSVCTRRSPWHRKKEQKENQLQHDRNIGLWTNTAAQKQWTQKNQAFIWPSAAAENNPPLGRSGKTSRYHLDDSRRHNVRRFG